MCIRDRSGVEWPLTNMVRVKNQCDGIDVDYGEAFCTILNGEFKGAEDITKQRCYELGSTCRGYQRKVIREGLNYYYYDYSALDPTTSIAIIDSVSFMTLNGNVGSNFLKIASTDAAAADCEQYGNFCLGYGTSTSGYVLSFDPRWDFIETIEQVAADPYYLTTNQYPEDESNFWKVREAECALTVNCCGNSYTYLGSITDDRFPSGCVETSQSSTNNYYIVYNRADTSHNCGVGISDANGNYHYQTINDVSIPVTTLK